MRRLDFEIGGSALIEAELRNLYGPTEADRRRRLFDLPAGTCRSTGPIRHPAANTEIYVVDRWMRSAPTADPRWAVHCW